MELIEPKFKEGDVCRVIANNYDYTYDSMIGEIVTIDHISEYTPRFCYIKEEYWYHGEEDDVLLNIFQEDELELIEKINPKKLLLSKIV